MDQISAGASICESRRQNVPTEDWHTDGNKLLTVSSNLNLFIFEFEWFSKQISGLRPSHLRRREHLMSLAFCTRYIDVLWNPLVEDTTFRSVTAQMYPD